MGMNTKLTKLQKLFMGALQEAKEDIEIEERNEKIISRFVNVTDKILFSKFVYGLSFVIVIGFIISSITEAFNNAPLYLNIIVWIAILITIMNIVYFISPHSHE